MTALINTGTFLFGTYDTDLSRKWVGDKVSSRIINNKGIDGLNFRKYQLSGLGESLGLPEEAVNTILSENKTTPDRLSKIFEAARTDKNGISTVLGNNLKAKYQGADFGQVSLAERFKTNFNAAKEEDVIYKFFKGDKGVFKELGKELADAGAGKEGIKKLAAQAGKGFGKAMPFIGAIITVAQEIPNVFKSFADYGIGEGLKQTGRAALNMAGFAAGAAVGSIALPVVGSIVGGIAGNWLGNAAGDFIFGKSKVDIQSEIEDLGISKEQAKEVAKQGVNPEELKATLAQQQAQQVQAPQSSKLPQLPPFGSYAQPNYFQNNLNQTRYNTPFQGGFNSKDGISLGDENTLENMTRTYNMYQMAS